MWGGTTTDLLLYSLGDKLIYLVGATSRNPLLPTRELSQSMNFSLPKEKLKSKFRPLEQVDQTE